MLKSLLLAATLSFTATEAAAQAPTLKAGDAAPALQVKQWVKGDAVSGFAKDKLYVVEFWATWCGPCKKSIPHLTELAKTHKDVTFIGVSVWERDPEKVVPFVESMGSKMDYRVAMDDVAEGKGAETGAMATNWMKASGSGGIPTAFIVDKTGHIAWIGHPMEMEQPLEKIVAGKWDLAAYQKEKAEADALEAAASALGKKMSGLMKSKDLKGAIAAMEEGFVQTPKLEQRFGYYKFRMLLDLKEFDAGYAYAGTLIDGVLKEEAQALNAIAWTIVDPENKELTRRDLKVALKAALRANELTKGKDANILDTLAKVHFDSGDAAKAIEIQTKALELVKGTEQEADFQGRLDQYKTGKPAGT
jgi:thiol-disulfide isomerase/thioredoxin